MLKMIDETLDELLETTTQETTQEKIIELIKKNPSITQKDMAEKLKITRDGVSYNIKKLKENGIIKRIGSTKKGIWEVTKFPFNI